MINFSSKKTKNFFAKVIVVILAIAMILTLAAPFFG